MPMSIFLFLRRGKIMQMSSVSRQRKIEKITIIGSVVNLLLSVGKILAGILGRSAAMLADGVHSL